ncbi:MAG: class I SAM-dependent methyltransferase [Halodesulfurarchaeum sp.]
MDSTIQYFDETARYYDAYYDAQGPDDVEFFRDLAAATDGPVLEAACGTGRIYLELLEDGIDVDGFDASAGMLARLLDRAADAGLEPSVWQADMRDFAVDREYGLAIVAFRSFLHLLSIPEQLAALDRFHEALAPDGTLVIAVFAPSFDLICDQYGEWQEETVTVEGESYQIRTKQEIVDQLDQIAEGTQQVRNADGEIVAESTYRMAMIPRRQFELLLRDSPFTTWTVFGGFDREPLSDVEQEMVWEIEP